MRARGMYVPAGEDEFNIYMQKKYMGQSIYENRSTSRSEHWPMAWTRSRTRSKPLVKAMTLLALQPVASGARADELNYSIMVKNFGYIKLFLENPYFMLACLGMPSCSS